MSECVRKQPLLDRINTIRNAHIEKRNEGDECDQFANEAVADWLWVIQEEIQSGIFDAAENVRAIWECPDCGFAFDATHKDEGMNEYSCPNYSESELSKSAAEKDTEIQRLRTALEEILSLKDNASLIAYKYRTAIRIAQQALSGDRKG